MKKKTKTKTAKKKTASKTRLECGTCGLIVNVDPSSDCYDTSRLVCCGSPMEVC